MVYIRAFIDKNGIFFKGYKAMCKTRRDIDHALVLLGKLERPLPLPDSINEPVLKQGGGAMPQPAE